MSFETELKFLVDHAAIEEIWQRGREEGLVPAKPRARAQVTIYYDTATRDLWNEGISLRLRKQANVWTQSVKRRRRRKGPLHKVRETEARVAGQAIEFAAFNDPDLRALIESRVEPANLAPVFETRIKRRACVIALDDGARVELAIDEGEIRAGTTVHPLREMELELIEGDVDALFAVALKLMPDRGIRCSSLSKSQRGHLLARENRIFEASPPQQARQVEIPKRSSMANAARRMLEECTAQISFNITCVCELDDPEGRHQLRIGLRRLRSVLKIFSKVFASCEAVLLLREARWLGRRVGRLRDIDVVRDEIVAAAIVAQPDEQGLATLNELLAERSVSERNALRQLLSGKRVQVFELKLERLTGKMEHEEKVDGGKRAPRAEPLKKHARRELDRLYRKACHRGRKISKLDVAQRHKLRKTLKHLRYAAEFFGPLFSRKRTRRFLKHLKRLQVVFGDLNDAATLHAVLDDLQNGQPEIGELQRPIGWICGHTDAKAEDSWEHAVDLWKRFAAARPFWQ